MAIGLTFDTGALLALERKRQRMTDVFRRATQRAIPITVCTVVLAEWWRGQKGKFARHLLAAVDIEPVTEELALLAGEALADTGRSNVVDAIVVASAALRGDIIYTSDVDDLARLAERFGKLRVLGV